MLSSKIMVIATAISLCACANTASPAQPVVSQNIIVSQEEQINNINDQINQLKEKIQQLQTRVQQLERRPQSPRRLAPPPKQITTQKSIPPTEPNLVARKNNLITAQNLYKNKQYQEAAQNLRFAESGGDGSENARASMFLLLKSHKQLNNCLSVINIGQRYASQFSSNPTAAEALFLVGECQWQIQQQDSARDTWHKLIRLYPNTPAAQRATQKI